MNFNCDVLIIGTGVAGLFTALNISEDINVILVSKSKITESNSYLAQGGISTALDKDDIDSFVQDTLKAGNFKNNEKVVYMVAQNSMEIINDLINLGVDFDSKNGKICYTKEGGHSKNRIVHYKDYTGKKVIDTLISNVKKKKNIKIFEDTTLIDLINIENKCYGGIFFNENKLLKIYSSLTVVATGGIGGLFKNSTNQPTLKGDALSIALRHNIKLKDIEYIQFHPTSLYQTTNTKRFLISESLRGEGAVLKNVYGKRFVNELLPRDKVALNILKELKYTNTPYVYLDISHLDNKYIIKRFPLIYNECLKYGFDITKEPIPVRPAQHYHMGGIEVDFNSKTSMKNLFAVGEVSCTGLHGNNRLASNSLLEGLVYAKNCAKFINKNLIKSTIKDYNLELDIDALLNQNKTLFKNELMKIREDIKNELI